MIGGVKYFPLQNRRVKLVAQKYAFYPRIDYHNDLSEQEIVSRFDIIPIDSSPFGLGENLLFLGSIPSSNNFEKRKNFGKVKLPSGESVEDFCKDDSALIYRSLDGIIVITGCSHSGMCNIIQYASEVAEKNGEYLRLKQLSADFTL